MLGQETSTDMLQIFFRSVCNFPDTSVTVGRTHTKLILKIKISLKKIFPRDIILKYHCKFSGYK